MANAAVRKVFWERVDSLRLMRDLGSDPAAMTSGNLVRGRLHLVAVPPDALADPANDIRVRVVWTVRNDDGATFDPAVVAAAFHSTADALRIRQSGTGPVAWSFVYCLEESGARVI